MPVQSFLSFVAGSQRSPAAFCCLWTHFSGLISKSLIFGVPELSYSLCCLYSCSSGNWDDWVWASRDHCCCSGRWCKKGWIRKDELSAPKLTFWLPKNKTWKKKKSRLPSFLKRKCNLVRCAFIFLLCSFSVLLISCASAYICMLKVSQLFVKKYQEKLHLVRLVHISGLLHKRNRLPWELWVESYITKERR